MGDKQKISDEEFYGASPKHPKKKSCLNCAYLKLEKHEYWEDTGDYDWYGEKADCFQNIWKRGFSEGLGDVLSYDVEYETIPSHKGNGTYILPCTIKTLHSVLGDNYGLTRIPTPEDGFIELATYTCQRFYPKKKLNQRTLATCWQDQLERIANRKNSIKFWVTTLIAVLGLMAAFMAWWK